MIGAHCVYPVDETIADFDLNTDIEEYNYDGRAVYRGNMDPEYSKDGRKVYWLYDDENKRVGLAEHTGDQHVCLWYRDNVFSTLLQEDWSVYDETVWQIMSETAYDDCIRNGYTVNDLKVRTQALQIVMPSDIVRAEFPRTCMRCFSAIEKGYPGCVADDNEKGSLTLFDTLFMDEDGTIYIPPGDSRVYATFLRRGAAAGAGAGAGDGAGTGAGGSIAAPPPYSASSSSSSSAPAPAPAPALGATTSSSSSSSADANAARALPGGGRAVASPSS